RLLLRELYPCELLCKELYPTNSYQKISLCRCFRYPRSNPSRCFLLDGSNKQTFSNSGKSNFVCLGLQLGFVLMCFLDFSYCLCLNVCKIMFNTSGVSLLLEKIFPIWKPFIVLFFVVHFFITAVCATKD